MAFQTWHVATCVLEVSFVSIVPEGLKLQRGFPPGPLPLIIVQVITLLALAEFSITESPITAERIRIITTRSFGRILIII
jgi:hypothetical protein